jgi:putative ABC transport system substrate-binding protein
VAPAPPPQPPPAVRLDRASHGQCPLARPTKFQFLINLKNAKALGLNIPPGVLAIADDVIE